MPYNYPNSSAYILSHLSNKTMYYGPHESYEPGREMYNNDNIEDNDDNKGNNEDDEIFPLYKAWSSIK